MAKRTANIFVLYTGGTLGMVPSDDNNTASPLRPGSQAELDNHLPSKELESKGIHYTLEPFSTRDGISIDPVDSSDVNSWHWRHMADAIDRVYNEYDGFVILHGTDTMAYTASALSFMLSNLAKPVVVTGSQLPVADPRTDAVSNFVNALYVAGYRASDLPLIPEVVLVFAGTILRGNRVRKMSSAAWQGFDTPNYPHLGSIGEHIRIATEYVREPADNEESPFFTRLDLENQVTDLSLFPGIQPEQLEAVLLNDSLRGAVLRTFGSGNAPGNPELLNVIDRAVKAKKVIVNVTQCPEGMVEAGLYEASSGLLERGVISGLDLTPEAALTKLMTLLANDPHAEVETQMQLDLRGEQSANLYDLRFGSDTDGGREEHSVTVSARAAGEFSRAKLQQATIRLRGVRRSKPGSWKPDVLDAEGRLVVDAFLNYPKAPVWDGAATAAYEEDPRYAATLRIPWLKTTADKHDALADVTAVARRVLEGNRPVQLTFVPRGVPAESFHFDGAYLALFTR